jgi:hypothetical protein
MALETIVFIFNKKMISGFDRTNPSFCVTGRSEFSGDVTFAKFSQMDKLCTDMIELKKDICEIKEILTMLRTKFQ